MRLPSRSAAEVDKLAGDIDVEAVKRLRDECPGGLILPRRTWAATRPSRCRSPTTACRSAWWPTTHRFRSCSSTSARSASSGASRSSSGATCAGSSTRKREMLGLLVDWATAPTASRFACSARGRHCRPVPPRSPQRRARGSSPSTSGAEATAGSTCRGASRSWWRRRPGRAPARDAGDGGRAHLDRGRGARAVVQLQADVAGVRRGGGRPRTPGPRRRPAGRTRVPSADDRRPIEAPPRDDRPRRPRATGRCALVDRRPGCPRARSSGLPNGRARRGTGRPRSGRPRPGAICVASRRPSTRPGVAPCPCCRPRPRGARAPRPRGLPPQRPLLPRSGARAIAARPGCRRADSRGDAWTSSRMPSALASR